jgi:hypothetical protein
MTKENTDEVEYRHEPRRIRMGSEFSRWLFWQLGIRSARDERLETYRGVSLLDLFKKKSDETSENS